jgi:phosphatidylglycerophosphate synthase
MKKFFAFVSKHEKMLFLLVTIANLSPIFIGRFFPTLDGPSHLYNSNLVVNLLFNSEGLTPFYAFNPELVPNWSGHFILVLFSSILPSYMAEKILLLIYFIGLPYAFRSLILQLNSKNALVSYMIFPFLYSYPFILGFYNFSLAIGFLFLTLSYYLRHQNELYRSTRIKVLLFLLLLCTYFSHVILFAVLMLVIGVYILSEIIRAVMHEKGNINKSLKNVRRKAIAFFISSAIPMAMFLFFFSKRPSSGSGGHLPASTLFDALYNIRPLIAFKISFEKQYTQVIFFVFLSLVLFALVKWVASFFKKKDQKEKQIRPNHFTQNDNEKTVWLFSTIFMFALYFILPNSNSTGSFVSVRIALLFYLFLLIWLSTQDFPKWLMGVSVMTVLVCNGILISKYIETFQLHSDVAADCYAASEKIEEKSVVLPLKYGGPPVGLHFSNYLGVDKPVIILKNYECVTGYFPLVWNIEEIPESVYLNLVPGFSMCERMLNLINDNNVDIDYVFVYGALSMKSEECNDELNSKVMNDYNLVFSNSSCELYKRNL